MKINKIAKFISTFIITATMTVSFAFAAIPSNTVIVGGNAYNVDYLNGNDAAIMDLISAFTDPSKNIYVKVGDNLTLDLDGGLVDSANVPATTYYAADGSTKSFAQGDGEEVSSSSPQLKATFEPLSDVLTTFGYVNAEFTNIEGASTYDVTYAMTSGTLKTTDKKAVGQKSDAIYQSETIDVNVYNAAGEKIAEFKGISMDGAFHNGNSLVEQPKDFTVVDIY